MGSEMCIRDSARPAPRRTSSTAFATSMLEMFPFLLNHETSVSSSPSHEVFERFWVALCRNLYDEGL